MVTSKVDAKTTPFLRSRDAVTATPELEEAKNSRSLVDAFLAGRKASTLRAYRQDLADFQVYVEAANPNDAAFFLLGRGHGNANAVAIAYKAHLVDRGLAASTVNRRLSTLRSLVKHARIVGIVPWQLEAVSVRAKRYKDTAGPGLEAFKRLVSSFDEKMDPKSCRDLAIIRLLFDLALRRGEVVSMDISDLDLNNGRLFIVEKGLTDKVPLNIPEPTGQALSCWLAARGSSPGPVFVNFDRARKGSRLTGRSVDRMLKKRGQEVGIQNIRPHGLRHTAITAALDLSSGDIRAVQKFSRHEDARILLVYDDSRRDLGGEIARKLALASSK